MKVLFSDTFIMVRFYLLFFMVVSMVVICSCSVRSNMMEHLSSTILNNDDLLMVKEGAPAYLIMMDSLISDEPDSQKMLLTAAQLYTAYADLFVTDLQRSRKMIKKALNYADRAMCLANDDACGLKDQSFEKVQGIVNSMEKEDCPYLFTLGSAWAAWIIANKNDFNALVDIPSIKVIMLKVALLDEKYKGGSAFLYLGTLASFLPEALGGEPEQGKIYFEKAVSLSQGKNLMAKVLFAKFYAKMIFSRPLHDTLLTEVMNTDPVVPGYTLINIHAQKQARQLLDGADDYF